MSGFDEGRVTWSDQGLAEDSRSFGVAEFQDFIRQFQVGDEFPYRDQLKKNTNMHEYRLEVNLDDLMTFNPKLNDALREKPAELMPIFERAARDVYASMLVGRREEGDTPPDVQVIDYSKLVHIQGIVISASKPRVKATMITLQCKSCKKLVNVLVKPGLHGCSFPRACEGNPGADLQQKCPLDPFQVLSDRSKYVDLQTLKIQELPEQVPTGEMPRHITVTLDRHLVGRVVPGAVISAAGIFTILNQKPRQASASSVRVPYLRALGIMEVSGVGGRMTESDFTQEEESKFRSMAASPDFVEKLRGSIAPSIFGHADIKKALCCQLFGGSRKLLPDGGRLRGDINVLMLGDPSTAKSQLLKFIEKVAPISVYTSGKGSSAAGLTASVVKDANSGEFYLEGGAMVLADGGVVCIDEFDKMRPEDRVAIHEAMEQQTISIAKAGITTMLNTRTAVLAAANPTFGRYDDMRSAVDNIDFQSTILSRFDLIFIIRDARNEERDQRIARHVMSLHSGSSVQQVEGEIDLNTMRRYICYARTKCSPRLSESAAKRLQDEYIRIRQRYAQESSEGAPAIPITVRQLEAIIRISESLAKLTLSPLATERHVEEAVQLFKESTEDAASKGLMMEGMTSPAVMADVLKSEKAIKERVGIGMSVPERSLVGELKERGLSEGAVRKAISVMLQRQELELRSQGKYICRRR
ncbi:MCM5 DNA replication licensing minichromosome maintenance protein 5 [Guillardia theta CCMP2712]|uniref:DNA replication licensing factor MCM5 n=2 Tax=Guillardia theta TaxID=55529 RepID=L1JDS5_GUITC|nr:MCM5 DNA replication licensing minichromosome maintenance protein 5 [Guillardia theta CCMP2712]EKX46259.1 MCM5 DNA replication licensing minichromosome maintenance protein 5 [Guillardia theta CCMP2712]|eukprot:XP_005833239.1 MCM5 DNA replication licensing minichromosome maintenance protein 5 [Guillardia theta CCMP2712]